MNPERQRGARREAAWRLHTSRADRPGRPKTGLCKVHFASCIRLLFPTVPGRVTRLFLEMPAYPETPLCPALHSRFLLHASPRVS